MSIFRARVVELRRVTKSSAARLALRLTRLPKDHGYIAAGAVATAVAGCSYLSHQGRRSVELESKATYEPPPRFQKSFSSLHRSTPTDEATQLVWAVKHLEVGTAQDVLKKWPHGANLLDANDNTLFHLAASESERYSARPDDAANMVQLLLESGWPVVDLKNASGERADVVARKVKPNGIPNKLLAARSLDYQESLRAEAPLGLVGESSPVPWKWEYMLQDDKRRSWAGVLFGAIDDATCGRWFKDAADKSPWQGLPNVPRKVAWFVSEEFADVPYCYSGYEYPATVFPPWMEEIRREVCHRCGIPPEEYPNSCNVNIYMDHRGEVGWHSDDEVLFQSLTGDTRIISFSLGSARDFCWRLQGTAETIGSVPLGDGDIMTMEGLFQKHYKHCVPASKTSCGPRINFTFRWIKVVAHAADAGTKSTEHTATLAKM